MVVFFSSTTRFCVMGAGMNADSSWCQSCELDRSTPSRAGRKSRCFKIKKLSKWQRQLRVSRLLQTHGVTVTSYGRCCFVSFSSLFSNTKTSDILYARKRGESKRSKQRFFGTEFYSSTLRFAINRLLTCKITCDRALLW